VRAPPLPGAGYLPRPRTSFIGRDNELAEARQLLERARLLTLTGAGGCGKTRFAIAVANAVADDFPAGVHFVSLAAIRDPALVPVAIAQSIGLQDSRGRPLLEHLSGYVADGKVLLVLDNFEHLLSAGEFVGQLLDASARLRVVVTSRSPLHLSGEQQFPVPPLAVPRLGSHLSTAAVAGCEAVQLFAERAAASVPGFDIDDANAAAIAEITDRLGGLPLAIELAAARVKLLPPEAILARLEHSLGLLVSDRQDVPGRQRTLRATIAWSYELMSEDARRLLAACSVFRGGISLEIIETVVDQVVDLRMPVLDVVQELVDQSLLRPLARSGAAPRYVMLESVRQFAAERLADLSCAAAVHAAHAAAFWKLASDLARPPCWPDKSRLDRLELEHDNLRAALDWYGREDSASALRLANKLTAFWSARGHFSEGRRRLGELLELVPNDGSELVDALNGAAWLAIDQGDRATALHLLDQSVARAHAARDPVAEGMALFYRGRAKFVAIGPATIAPSWRPPRNPAGAESDFLRAIELLTMADDRAGVAAALMLRALIPMFVGEIEVACELFERSAAMSKELDIGSVAARAQQLLGVARLELGDLVGARAVLQQAVPAVVEIGDRFAIPVGMSAVAGIAALGGRPRSALMVAGAAAAYEEVNQTYRPEPLRAYLEGWLAPARAAVGSAAPKLIDEGRRMTVAEALKVGLDDQPEGPLRRGPASGLTLRESEITALVARGLTNREIAGQLYISVRTVEAHVDHILTKLGFRTRTQLAAWAHEEGSSRQIRSG
jgi:predicted ATPase/DNA-binding CsgD family transcriptional regulator